MTHRDRFSANEALLLYNKQLFCILIDKQSSLYFIFVESM